MTNMNAGAWIGIIGGIAGIIIAISAVNVVAGSSAPYITAAIVLVFGGMFFLFYKLLFGPMLNARRLMKTGIPGKAMIKQVKDTGITINNSPQVKLILEVRNSYGQKYEATLRTLVSRINPFVFQPGMEVPVMIDPKNEQNVIINPGVPAPNPGTPYPLPQTAVINEAALKSELEQLQQSQDSIALSGRAARAIVKKYHWLGTYVNGQNPYVELDLEVLPEHSSSFSAKTRGVLAETSVPKFQPGNEIHVKYDFYDNSKVVIDRSV